MPSRVDFRNDATLLAGVSRSGRAILVGPHDLIELNLERIARAVYSGATPPSRRKPEEKK
jgi:hypothetical protein